MAGTSEGGASSPLSAVLQMQVFVDVEESTARPSLRRAVLDESAPLIYPA